MERAYIIEAVAERLGAAQRVFVLTGAGLGIASGLGTFRGPDGIFSGRAASTARTRWRNHSFEQLASLAGFENNPELVWSWYNERIAACLAANPNAGHRALVELETLVPRLTIATQNVDGLQARAGSRRVLEIHGSIFDVKCTGTACVVSRETSLERLSAPFEIARLRHEGCGGMRRPGVVWFGEQLPQDALREALQESRQADVILVAGTAAQVEPAASLGRRCRSQTMVVEINPEPALRGQTEYILAQGAETGLPMIVDALRSRR